MTVLDIERARLDRGMTATDVAREAGVSPFVISRLENGKRVAPANAKRIADFFNVKVTDLAPFAPTNPPREPESVR